MKRVVRAKALQKLFALQKALRVASRWACACGVLVCGALVCACCCSHVTSAHTRAHAHICHSETARGKSIWDTEELSRKRSLARISNKVALLCVGAEVFNLVFSFSFAQMLTCAPHRTTLSSEWPSPSSALQLQRQSRSPSTMPPAHLIVRQLVLAPQLKA